MIAFIIPPTLTQDPQPQPSLWNSTNYKSLLLSKGSGSHDILQHIEVMHCFIPPPRQPHSLPNTPDRNAADLPDRIGTVLRSHREAAPRRFPIVPAETGRAPATTRTNVPS